MCEVCDFYDRLQPAAKANPALNEDGTRTIWGYYVPNDAKVLAKYCPLVGESLIAKIGDLLNEPRLLEVAGVAELTQRYLEGSFSKIRGVGFKLAANPLSILFWSKKHDRVMRVKTHETELLHGPMEKLALRTAGMRKLNRLLDQEFGIQIVAGCSCCKIAVATDDLDVLFESDYYNTRESKGRFFDADVLTVGNSLWDGISVRDVPPAILAASADFGSAEVKSYLRFTEASTEAIVAQRKLGDFGHHAEEARRFLLGEEAELVAVE